MEAALFNNGVVPFATPANTTGMGNPSLPSDDNTVVGSGDVLAGTVYKEKKPHKKKFRSLKNYLKKHRVG